MIAPTNAGITVAPAAIDEPDAPAIGSSGGFTAPQLASIASLATAEHRQHVDPGRATDRNI
ncbi:MAG: hypothetical protein J7500_14680 [Sphingomonas sp.]|uniref:hypothetical protein n=1 Tax=Sphingomonas sp. TaxID=28214 RepID=UPI001B1B54AC|nr:hypothetical protein [Sphingomonas sp.]MBO9623952.1 hypothetical protein [Sphingomonas sp.]